MAEWIGALNAMVYFAPPMIRNAAVFVIFANANFVLGAET